MLAGVFQRQKQREGHQGFLKQFPSALSEGRGGKSPGQADCPGLAFSKHILLGNLVDMRVFLLFLDGLNFAATAARAPAARGSLRSPRIDKPSISTATC